MNYMRTVIIDDENKGRLTIKNLINKYTPQLELVGEADSVENGVELIEREKPELVFLDIEMPDGTGFDVLTNVEYSEFHLIFCTAYDQYAVKAFRFSAIDYLLKPLDPDIFKIAVSKVCDENKAESVAKIETLNTNKTEFKKLALSAAEGITIVNIDDVIRCESSVNYTHFIILDGSKVLVSKTLKEFDEMLSQHGFFRVHKSHLVNLNHIKKYIKGEGGWVIMVDDSKIEVSRRKKDALLKALGTI
jgi:two-component system LytT family response regulator